MKQLLIAAVLASTALPASAGFFEQFEEFSEESKKFMEDWAEEFGPSFEALGPKLDSLMDKIDDWTLYEMPEVLPNGDIIIRRKTPPKTPAPAAPSPQSDAIEL